MHELIEKLCRIGIDEKYVEYVTLQAVIMRLKEFMYGWRQLECPLSILYEMRESEREAVKDKWAVLPKGTPILVEKLMEPQMFVEPEVEINPVTKEFIRGRTVGVRMPGWADVGLSLSQHSWIYLAWRIHVKDLGGEFSDAYRRSGTTFQAYAPTLELWYCLSPGDFIELTEQILPFVRLWHFSQPFGERFFQEAYSLWESFWEDLYKAQRTAVVPSQLDEHLRREREVCLQAQESFDGLCREFSVPGKWEFISVGFFREKLRYLFEGKAYWGMEFWGPRITSPMQLLVRELYDEYIFGKQKLVALRAFKAWYNEVAQRTYEDPRHFEVGSPEDLWNIEPGQDVTVEGALSVKFESEDGKFYANARDFALSVGVELPPGFNPKDPWSDRPLGRRRLELWKLVERAKEIINRNKWKKVTLARDLEGIYNPKGGKLHLFIGSVFEVLPLPDKQDFSLSRITPFMESPTEFFALEHQWTLEKLTFTGIYKYSSILVDLLDDDKMPVAVRLFELASILDRSFPRRIEECRSSLATA